MGGSIASRSTTPITSAIVLCHTFLPPSRPIRRPATTRPLLVPRVVLAQHKNALTAGDNAAAAAHAPKGGLSLEGSGAGHSCPRSDDGGRRRQTRHSGGYSTDSGRWPRRPEAETRCRGCRPQSGECAGGEAGEEGGHGQVEGGGTGKTHG